MTWRKRTGRLYPVMLAAFLTFGVMAPAVGQDLQNLLNRIDRMERDMQDLQRQFYRGGGAAPASAPGTPSGQAPSGQPPVAGGATPDNARAARVEIRLQQLESLIRELTGKIEEVGFRLEQNAGRVERLARDVDFRLQELEKRAAAAISAVPQPGGGAGVAAAPVPAPQAQQPQNPQPQSRQPDGQQSGGQQLQAGQGQGVFGYLKESEVRALDTGTPTDTGAAPQTISPQPAPQTAAKAPPLADILPGATPEEQYRNAFAYLRKQDFESAEQALGLFLERHPQNPLAGNAIYWLGETYYVRKDFARAAKTFGQGYTTYPGSSKTADNLLKLGFSLARMDRSQDACLALDRLRADFPNASANIRQRAEAERARIGC